MPVIPEKGTTFQFTPGRVPHGIAIILRQLKYCRDGRVIGIGCGQAQPPSTM
jgi:hypothetical protein